MKNLSSLFKAFNGRKLLAILPHPDDESFVAGGLFQLANKYRLQTDLICLTSGVNKKEFEKRKKELGKACELIGIKNIECWDFYEGKLTKNVSTWLPKLKSKLNQRKPDIVLAFDASGITGHPDYIVAAVELVKLVKSLRVKPLVLLRVADKVEKNILKRIKRWFFQKPLRILLI